MYSAPDGAIWTEIVFFGLKRTDRRFHFVRLGDQVREAVVIHVARNRVLICRFVSSRTEQICLQLLPKEKRTRNCKKSVDQREKSLLPAVMDYGAWCKVTPTFSTTD